MKKTIFFLSLFLFRGILTYAQVISGPMLGPVELRTAKLWLEVVPGTKVDLWYWKKEAFIDAKKIGKVTTSEQWFAPLQFVLTDLSVQTEYEYQFILNPTSKSKPTLAQGSFKTKDLWQWRKPAPDFSFLTGSCTYFNEAVYDRTGKPYGGDSSIFLTMSKEKAAFMLWLGDNWYTRETDYYDEWGLWKRASRDRSSAVLQPFLKSTSHLAIWDDHDYGPNDMGKQFILKETSRDVFKNYWLNTSYGMEGKGIYTTWGYGDVDVFMMDDRWWRSADNLADSVNGQPNKDKRMWGYEQLEWLKQSLLSSRATFKIIANGSQILNPVSPYDKLADFPYEYNEFMNFLSLQKINGVLFLTGDRHHSEIIKLDRAGAYPLYDITVSPLTSGTHFFGGPEKNNPYRILGIDQKQNYGKVSVTGERGKRKLKIDFIGVAGETLGNWSIDESALKLN
jgi:alkaline phosphatase D